jgi:hypothetical protein
MERIRLEFEMAPGLVMWVAVDWDLNLYGVTTLGERT